jgi:hypothetical protein
MNPLQPVKKQAYPRMRSKPIDAVSSLGEASINKLISLAANSRNESFPNEILSSLSHHLSRELQ